MRRAGGSDSCLDSDYFRHHCALHHHNVIVVISILITFKAPWLSSLLCYITLKIMTLYNRRRRPRKDDVARINFRGPIKDLQVPNVWNLFLEKLRNPPGF